MTAQDFTTLQGGIALALGIVLFVSMIGCLWLVFRFIRFIFRHPVLAIVAFAALICAGFGYLASIPVMEGVRERVKVVDSLQP